MASHKIRKFKKVLINNSPFEIDLYIRKKWQLNKSDILKEIHDLSTLELFKEKIDFSGMNYQDFCEILKTCKYEKGVFFNGKCWYGYFEKSSRSSG